MEGHVPIFCSSERIGTFFNEAFDHFSTLPRLHIIDLDVLQHLLRNILNCASECRPMEVGSGILKVWLDRRYFMIRKLIGR